MDLDVTYYTGCGARPINEDAVTLQENEYGTLALIADGLGGYEDGEVASQLAVSTINRALQACAPDEDLLIEAIQEASRQIYSHQQPHKTMLTTAAALWLSDGSACCAHVGDSRIYQFRGGQIVYQSVDHSVAQVAVLVGELQQADIRTCTDRNKLVRVLGGPQPPKVDCRPVEVLPGDCFLLCSDGFWEAVTEDAMLRTLGEAATNSQWLSAMKELVLRARKPNQDNHTAIAIRINEVE